MQTMEVNRKSQGRGIHTNKVSTTEALQYVLHCVTAENTGINSLVLIQLVPQHTLKTGPQHQIIENQLNINLTGTDTRYTNGLTRDQAFTWLPNLTTT